MISRIDHVSVAVLDFEKAARFFQDIFKAVPGAEGKDNHLKYLWKIFSMGDLTRIELITPTGKGSFLENFLRNKKDGGIHHITLETHDIHRVKMNLEENGIPYFAFNADNDRWKELFIHPKDAFGVLIQIAQFNPNDYLAPSQKLPSEKKWYLEKLPEGVILHLAHPGGGKASFELKKDDVEELIQDLKDKI